MWNCALVTPPQGAAAALPHLKDDAEELHDDGLHAAGGQDHSEEEGVAQEAGEDVVLVIDSARVDLVSNLAGGRKGGRSIHSE